MNYFTILTAILVILGTNGLIAADPLEKPTAQGTSTVLAVPNAKNGVNGPSKAQAPPSGSKKSGQVTNGLKIGQTKQTASVSKSTLNNTKSVQNAASPPSKKIQKPQAQNLASSTGRANNSEKVAQPSAAPIQKSNLPSDQKPKLIPGQVASNIENKKASGTPSSSALSRSGGR